MQRVNKKPPKRSSFKEFCRTSSLNSLRYLQEDNYGLLQILIWTCINMFLMGITIPLVTSLWDKLTENPTVTSLKSTNHPVNEVPFPAISVCDINKISKRKAEAAAVFISEITGSNTDVIIDYIKLLGSFYDFDGTHSHKLIEFQKILEKFSHVDEFQITTLMRRLTPSCEEFLVSCRWKQQEVNCSDIFQMRLTFEGYCCAFNYVKYTNEIIKDDYVQEEILSGDTGMSNGLTVELNIDLEDYFYTKQASLGASIHVFSPNDYPDKNSGSLSEHLVGFASEFFLQLEAKSVQTVEDVIDYPIEKRGCYFPFEKTTRFGDYSESDCLVDCKIKSMIGLCGCVPFMIPISDQKLVCGLSDIQCLQKYKIKWESLAPSYSLNEEFLLKEAHYSLRCDNRCYPLCEATLYEMTTNMAQLTNPSFGNNTILHIFYRDQDSTMYQQDVLYYWFEIISHFGGTIGLIIGFSAISAIEVLSYCAYKMYLFVR